MAKKVTPRATGPIRWLSGPLPVIALVICHLALGLSAAGRKSMTFDESAHLGGGLELLGHERLPVARRKRQLVAALGSTPALSARLQARPQSPVVDHLGRVGNHRELDTHHGQPNRQHASAACRAMTAVSSALLALLVYFWSRYIFGAIGGVISLALYAFSPGMLANGFLVTSDVMATLFFTASCTALWILLHRVTWLTLAATVLSLTGLVLSKYSGVLIVPMALVMVVARLTRATPLHVQLFGRREITGRLPQLLVFAAAAVAQTLGVIFLVWASYGFRYAMFAPQYQEGSVYQVAWTQLEGGMSKDLAIVVQFARDHHLLPEGYLYGFSYTLLYAGQRAGFLNGVFAYRGWVSFFPLCLLWKTPLELFAVLGFAAWAFVACPGGAGF